jgi:hypothetical protein
MSELTRRRDTSRNEETWLIFLENVHIGTIGRRAGVPTDAEQWGWRCGFPSGSRRGRAQATAADFAEARSQFEPAWRTLQPSYTDADFADYRRARAWTAWKQAMWETGRKLPTQTQEGRARCFCGAEIDITSMDGHVTAAHMTECAGACRRHRGPAGRR